MSKSDIEWLAEQECEGGSYQCTSGRVTQNDKVLHVPIEYDQFCPPCRAKVCGNKDKAVVEIAHLRRENTWLRWERTDMLAVLKLMQEQAGDNDRMLANTIEGYRND